MNWLAIIAYVFALVINVKFFYFAYSAMTLHSDSASKSFYYGLQIDVFILWFVGAAISQFYLFVFWTAHFLIKAISTNKLMSRKNLLRLFYFICLSLIIQLMVISGTNFFVGSDFSLSILDIFFINHGILTLGLFLAYPLLTVMRYGMFWSKLKMNFLVCLVFSFISLLAYGLFQLLLFIQSHISFILIISLVLCYFEFKKLKMELIAYKSEEPGNEYSSSDPKMQNLMTQIENTEFRDFRKIGKRKVIQQQEPTEKEYEMPKNCPYCANPLIREGYCENCKVKICPKCYSQVSSKIQQCTCGYIFKFGIPKPFSPLEPKKSALEAISSKIDQKSIDNLSDSPSSEDINIEGPTNIPRMCPYCGAIGWKEDICRCGYDYINKVYRPKEKNNCENKTEMN